MIGVGIDLFGNDKLSTPYLAVHLSKCILNCGYHKSCEFVSKLNFRIEWQKTLLVAFYEFASDIRDFAATLCCGINFVTASELPNQTDRTF